MNLIQKKGECIRRAINNSSNKDFFKFDKSSYNKTKINENLNITSPKVVSLLKNIKELDDNDFLKYGKRFKHIIYSDLRNSLSGIKMIASVLKANDYNNIYDDKLNIDIKEDENYNNFGLLTSMTIYNKPFSIKLRNEILKIFNSRPDNINGKKIRFLLIDQGFKEGIDVYDVKYLHIFDEVLSPNDEKQVIGRGTRLCGQKGIQFHPELGWPLHVFKYRLLLSKELKNKYNDLDDVFSLYLKEAKIDIRKLYFASELENICRFGAVDYEINRAIHEYGNEKEDNLDIITIIDIINKFRTFYMKDEYSSFDRKIENKEKKDDFDLIRKARYKFGGSKSNIKNIIIKKNTKKFIDITKVKKPRIKFDKKMDFIEMRKHIRKFYKEYKWTNVKFENLCIPNEKEIKTSRIIELTKSQLFVSNFFCSSNPYKGMLFWHSVGTGKTCAAIATASNSFEKDDYTILWITRHTLKPFVWKNIFSQVCSRTIKEKLEKGEKIPENPKSNHVKYLNNRWIIPLSYKQFTNLIEGKNKFYLDLKKRNGSEDPLRKTLIIIDEAHKLFSEDTPKNERPNIKTLKKAIYHSYSYSKKDSCRLILMTATPYTNEPIQLFKLLNLLKEDDYFPETFDKFKNEYLDSNYKFTKDSSRKFLDEISGYISYLNREKDVRQFAYPVLYIKDIEMSSNEDYIEKINFYKLFFEDIKDYLLVSTAETKKIINNLEIELISKLKKSEIQSQETTIKDCLNIKIDDKININYFFKHMKIFIKQKEKEEKQKKAKEKKEAKEKQEANYEIIDGKKYKKCPEGKIRNLKSKRCIKIK